MSYSSVFFDFGGVVLTSPFDAFNTYEEANGLPRDIIRTINAADPDANAWAKLERSEVDGEGFAELFSEEARSFGHEIDGHAVLGLLHGEVRPSMVEAIRRIKGAGLGVACLTNNVRRDPAEVTTDRDREVAAVMELFDEVIESSVVGVRKPEVRFYEIALERMGVEPAAVVFLDDLGINLKPARALGMTTIKVFGADQALDELESVLGLALR